MDYIDRFGRPFSAFEGQCAMPPPVLEGTASLIYSRAGGLVDVTRQRREDEMFGRFGPTSQSLLAAYRLNRPHGNQMDHGGVQPASSQAGYLGNEWGNS